MRVFPWFTTLMLATIAAPARAGEHDALFSRRDQTDLLAAIPGAQLVVYPDTGHCPNWERPDRVVTDLVAFVSGNTVGRRDLLV